MFPSRRRRTNRTALSTGRSFQFLAGRNRSSGNISYQSLLDDFKTRVPAPQPSAGGWDIGTTASIADIVNGAVYSETLGYYVNGDFQVGKYIWAWSYKNSAGATVHCNAALVSFSCATTAIIVNEPVFDTWSGGLPYCHLPLYISMEDAGGKHTCGQFYLFDRSRAAVYASRSLGGCIWGLGAGGEAIFTDYRSGSDGSYPSGTSCGKTFYFTDSSGMLRQLLIAPRTA